MPHDLFGDIPIEHLSPAYLLLYFSYFRLLRPTHALHQSAKTPSVPYEIGLRFRPINRPSLSNSALLYQRPPLESQQSIIPSVCSLEHTMSLATLPVEILENIFEPLSATSLSSLARTSTDFYPTATRFLYRRVSLSSFAQNLSAVTTLATRRHLALLVRSFSISLDDGKDQVDGEYYTSLCHAVQNMEGLITLDLNVDANSSWILQPATSASSSARCYRLEHFSCSFPLDAYTAAFLERTPFLRSLQVAPSPEFVQLSPSAIPCLTTYTGPPCLLPHLLAPRSVSTLHLSGDFTLEDVEQLASVSSAPSPVLSSTGPESCQSADGGIGASVKVETLSTITSSPPVAIIEALAKACPSLVSLRVITTCAFWETPDIVSPRTFFFPANAPY